MFFKSFSTTLTLLGTSMARDGYSNIYPLQRVLEDCCLYTALQPTQLSKCFMFSISGKKYQVQHFGSWLGNLMPQKQSVSS